MAWIAATTATLALLAATPASADSTWRRVGSDSLSGVSGVAVEGGNGARVLVVHDNYLTGQQRLSRVTLRDGSETVSPLTWVGAEPHDLEAIEAIPGEPGKYVALASRGIIYHLKVAGSTATVVDYSPLPAIGERDNFESFAMVSRNGKLAALWADRGAGADRPATLYSAPLTFAPWGQPRFGAVTHRPYRVRHTTTVGMRHISDIAVTDTGRIIVSSAADAGDDGPFESAVSDVGTVTVSTDGRVLVAIATLPTVLGTFPEHKVEAVECLPGSAGTLLGTDDENLGGYLRTQAFCRS